MEGRLRKTEDAGGYRRRTRSECRDAFVDAVGGLPERTPLNPQVVGTVARRGYRVEKIIFESQPKHYVTGLLFLPDPQAIQAAVSGRARAVRACV